MASVRGTTSVALSCLARRMWPGNTNRERICQEAAVLWWLVLSSQAVSRICKPKLKCERRPFVETMMEVLHQAWPASAGF